MHSKGEKRLRLARELGRTGAWLALVLTVTGWLSTALLLMPTHADLTTAQTQLVELDTRLADAQATLAPFDLLGRPETLNAVKTLNDLAESAQRAPLVHNLFGNQNLQDAVTLTSAWETTLKERPPLPALQEAREAVQHWQRRVQALQERLTLLGLGICVVFTLLGAWFAVGQCALYQRANERLSSVQRVN